MQATKSLIQFPSQPLFVFLEPTPELLLLLLFSSQNPAPKELFSSMHKHSSFILQGVYHFLCCRLHQLKDNLRKSLDQESPPITSHTLNLGYTQNCHRDTHTHSKAKKRKLLYWHNGLNKNRVGRSGFFFFFEELFLTEFIKHFISSAQCKSVVTFLAKLRFLQVCAIHTKSHILSYQPSFKPQN